MQDIGGVVLMSINLQQANTQAQQLQGNSTNIINLRTQMQNFRQSLNTNWRGEEVHSLNMAIDSIMQRLSGLSAEVSNIAAEIPPAAQEVRRQEELATARVVLAREDANVANLQRAFETAQRNHSRANTPVTLNILNTARTRLNDAIQIRNNAARRVNALL